MEFMSGSVIRVAVGTSSGYKPGTVRKEGSAREC